VLVCFALNQKLFGSFEQSESADAWLQAKDVSATMNRRKFLTQAAGTVGAAIAQSGFAHALQAVSSGPEVRVTHDLAQTHAVVPPDFMGLGYEISSVARPGLLSAQNAVYVQLVQTLGNHGVIRVGGNTADYASYSKTGQPLSSPERKAGSVVNDSVRWALLPPVQQGREFHPLRHLGSFLNATGWKLIWA
jgi:hypothetical protein